MFDVGESASVEFIHRSCNYRANVVMHGCLFKSLHPLTKLTNYLIVREKITSVVCEIGFLNIPVSVSCDLRKTGKLE